MPTTGQENQQQAREFRKVHEESTNDPDGDAANTSYTTVTGFY